MAQKSFVAACSAVLLFSVSGAFALLTDSVAYTPPMGFNTWNYFACANINQANVIAVAASMVQKHPANWEGKSISLKDAGYKYVNLDDCWPTGTNTARAADSSPTVSTTKFPKGFPWLTDTIHSMGMKIGIYSCCGTSTCAGYMASFGYEVKDANTYVKWGFDYLKEDWCNVPSAYTNAAGSATLYSKMDHALRNAVNAAYTTDSARAKHRVCFSLCSWGSYNVWAFGDTCGNLWRTTNDINASWSSIYGNWNSTIGLYAYAGPGGWNDPDMLEIGNGSLSDVVNRSHMDMWCIAAAPLLMGNNTPAMSETTFTTLSNREVIAVDQDSLGYQGRRVRTPGNIQIVVKKLKVTGDTTNNGNCIFCNRKWAVVILNTGSSAANGTVLWSDIGETNSKAAYKVRNLWQHRIKGQLVNDATIPDTNTVVTDSVYATNIPSDGTVHILLTKYYPTSTIPAHELSTEFLKGQMLVRVRGQACEVFVPAANTRIQVFDAQGKQLSSLFATQPAWYRLPARPQMRGPCIIHLQTSSGTVADKMFFAR